MILYQFCLFVSTCILIFFLFLVFVLEILLFLVLVSGIWAKDCALRLCLLSS